VTSPDIPLSGPSAARPRGHSNGQPRRVLIAGASGFLGTHVLAAATDAGLEAVTAGRSPLPESRVHCLADLSADQPAQLAALLAAVNPDIVVNCAGVTGGSQEDLAAVNITGTYALVRAVQMTARPIRLVHLGSAAEYGPGEPGTAVAETAPCRPASPYGLTKLAATRLVELGRAAGVDAVVLRVFNPVGARAPETILPGRVAAQLRRALAAGTTVSLGPLDAVRDFVDARDVAAAVLAAGLAPALADPVLNIGSGVGRPCRALVTELAAISGYTGPVDEESAGSPRSAAPSWQEADIGKAVGALAWSPSRDLRPALTRLWESGHAALAP
jgi:nucleoside-diphosphate-sugar epimerase